MISKKTRIPLAIDALTCFKYECLADTQKAIIGEALRAEFNFLLNHFSQNLNVKLLEASFEDDSHPDEYTLGYPEEETHSLSEESLGFPFDQGSTFRQANFQSLP